jgi:hypothetical protein
MSERNTDTTSGTLYAINKTAGKAFKRSGEADDWEPVDPKTVNQTANLERAGHLKIGNNWFSVYKEGSHGK